MLLRALILFVALVYGVSAGKAFLDRRRRPSPSEVVYSHELISYVTMFLAAAVVLLTQFNPTTVLDVVGVSLLILAVNRSALQRVTVANQEVIIEYGILRPVKDSLSLAVLSEPRIVSRPFKYRWLDGRWFAFYINNSEGPSAVEVDVRVVSGETVAYRILTDDPVGLYGAIAAHIRHEEAGAEN